MKEQLIKLDQLDFTDRESYIAWRAEWRVAYKALSQEIRENRNAFKAMQRKVYMAKFPGNYWGMEPAIDDKPLWSCREYSRALTLVDSGRFTAHKMMEIRTRSKEKAAALRNGEEYKDFRTVVIPAFPLPLTESKPFEAPMVVTSKTLREDPALKEMTWKDRIFTFLSGRT